MRLPYMAVLVIALLLLLTSSSCRDGLVEPPTSSSSFDRIADAKFTVLAGEAGAVEWLLQFGTVASDFAWDVHTDEAGNVYVAGDVGGALPGETWSGAQLDAYLRKFDADGNVLWTRQFGTGGVTRGFGVFALGGEVYVTGPTFGAFPGFVNLSSNSDVFLRKYDAAGAEVWTRQFGTAGFDEPVGIFVDETGVYVSGIVTGTLPGQTQVAGQDAFVRKYDALGDEVWTRQFGTARTDRGFGISGDESGIYVVGLIDGGMPAPPPDAFVRKYDRGGNELWTRRFGTPAVDLATKVATDATGIYVAGRTDGQLPNQTQAGAADAFVRKFDRDGGELWTRQFGGLAFDIGRGISTRNSVVYVSGVTGGASGQFPAATGSDVFVRAWTANGKELWSGKFGSSLAEDNWAIRAGSHGLFVVGATGGELPGLSTHGNVDAFVGRLVPEIIVEIVIKPGSDGSPINSSARVVPIAILSTDAFDASSVDPATVAFEGARVRRIGSGAPMASLEDVNGDGLADLVVQIEASDMQFPPPGVNAELTARTFNNRVVFGSAPVRIVP